MAINRSQAVLFTPLSASDSLDGTNTPPGGMSALTNLIPDPTTRGLFYARPASFEQTDFTGFTTPGFVSVFRVIGTRIYGMVASALTPGRDQPFCFDITSGTFIAITGVTPLNVPISPSDTGEWTPPVMSLVGVILVITHPGFTGAGGNYFAWIDLTNPAAPDYDAGNVATQPLTAVPVSVAQFYNRAYFAVGNALIFSDILNALTVTGSDQVLTLGDDVEITALGGLPLNNQLGGIIQALIAFKGVSVMYQVTGDKASSDLALNALNIATGTFAQNSVTPTPKGLAFMSPEGLRVIDFQANVSDPIGTAGDGVTVPFIYTVVPSRICASYNANVVRISSQNGFAPGTPDQEYWFDMVRNIWTGPHSFPASLIGPYSDTFIKTAIGVDAKLFQSDPVQTAVSTYVENGDQMEFLWQTTLLPDTRQMEMNSVVLTTINMALAPEEPFTVTAVDQNGSEIDSVEVMATGAATYWGAFTWGVDLWQGAQNALSPRLVPWTEPIVFEKLSIAINGNCAAGLKIGNLYMRYKVLKYIQPLVYP